VVSRVALLSGKHVYAGSLSPAASSSTDPKKKEFAEARKLLFRAN